MAKLSIGQLKTLAQNAGFPAVLLDTMAAIAMAESGGNPTSTNPTDNGGKQTSWGLWQISDGTHNVPPGWSNPQTNANMAYAKYKSQGLNAWGTYTSGAYKRYLPGMISGGGASASTIGQVFDQKNLWKWWEQNNGKGTNAYNGVTEKGIDYSTTFATPVCVPVGGKIVRSVHNNNSIGDVVELQASDGSVWLYQHIDTNVKVGQKLGVSGTIGTEDGLPVDQYSTGPHIEVRYCKPGTWNPNTDSWNEPWVNPFLVFSGLSNKTVGGPIDGSTITSTVLNGGQKALNVLTPNASVTATLYALDQFMTLKNPFDTSGETIDQVSFLGSSPMDNPFTWLGTVGSNMVLDIGAATFRLILAVVAVFILWTVIKKFVDVGAIAGTALKAGESVAMLGAL